MLLLIPMVLLSANVRIPNKLKRHIEDQPALDGVVVQPLSYAYYGVLWYLPASLQMLQGFMCDTF